MDRIGADDTDEACDAFDEPENEESSVNVWGVFECGSDAEEEEGPVELHFGDDDGGEEFCEESTVVYWEDWVIV